MNDVKPKLTYKEYVVLVARAKKQTQENQSNSVLYSIDDRINICFYVNQR